MADVNVFRGDERSWQAQYAAIGEFVVEFEWCCWRLRFAASALLQHFGLGQWSLAEVIFHQRAFTAEPLFECYASLVAEALPNDEDLLSRVAAVRKEFKDVCKLRNDLLHASYLIGPSVVEVTDKAAPTEFHAEKRTPNKTGARVQVLAESLDDMKSHIAEARLVRKHVDELFAAITIALVRSQRLQEGPNLEAQPPGDAGD